MTAGKLTVLTDGRLAGSTPAGIVYNSPFPCVNGRYGSGAMMGVLMHTMVGNLPGCVSWFNNPAAQASAHFGVAQDGLIHQFGPIGKGWIAWHAADANLAWYGIEHADNGYPSNPLTDAQLTASAQLVECLSAFAGFPLQISDSPAIKGYGWHGMGGAAWGGHPDCPGDVRKAQRGEIIRRAAALRGVAPAPSGPVYGVPRIVSVSRYEVFNVGLACDGGTAETAYHYQMIDSSGRLVAEDRVAGGSLHIDAGVPPGTYRIRLAAGADDDHPQSSPWSDWLPL